MLRTCTLIINFVLFATVIEAQTSQQYQFISNMFYNAGKFDSSLHYALKAEAIIKKESTKNSVVYAYHAGQYLAMTYEKLGDTPAAEHWFKKSIRLYEDLHDTLSIGYAETLANLGNFSNTLGLYNEALPYLVKAERILRTYAWQINSYGGALNNLANVYGYLGNYAKATGSFYDLLSLIEKGYKSTENKDGAIVYSNLATVYNKTGLWKKAEQNFEKSCSIFKKIGDQNKYFMVLLNLGHLYAAQNKTEASIKIFNEILDNIDTAKDFVLYGAALNGVAQVMEQQNKLVEAETYYLTALKELRKDERGISSYNGVGYKLASFYACNGKTEKADSIFRLILNDPARLKRMDKYNYVQFFSGFCANLVRANKLSEAADSLQSLTKYLFHSLYRNFEGMPQEDKMRFVQTLKTSFDLVYSILASGKASREITRLGLYNLLQLKGMILTNQALLYNEARNSPDTMVVAAFHNWQRTQQLLYKQYSLNKVVLSTDSLEAQSENYERRFSVAVPNSLLEDQEVLIEKIRKSLSSNEAAIEFVQFDYISAAKDQVMYGAFIIKPGEAEPQFVVLCKEQQLRQLFAIKKGQTANADSLLKRLYQKNNLALYKLLWKPMQQYLPNGTNIYYSPAGLINSISLNAITTGNNKLLMDRHNLYLFSEAGNIIDKTARYTGKPVFATIWGNINYSKEVYKNLSADKLERRDSLGDENLLPDGITKGGSLREEWKALSNIETNKIKAILLAEKVPVKTYERTYATEENFNELSNGSQGIIHISTHGFFASGRSKKPGEGVNSNMHINHVNPLLRCGLIFSGANYVWLGNEPLPGREDGILTGYEIAQMDLSKVDMVVLSACETGLGDINEGYEGVIGLQRAFRLAGVKKLIVSLWKVPEKQTADLMAMFYKNLLNGKTASEALLNSQREMHGQNLSPYYWAGFVVLE